MASFKFNVTNRPGQKKRSERHEIGDIQLLRVEQLKDKK